MRWLSVNVLLVTLLTACSAGSKATPSAPSSVVAPDPSKTAAAPSITASPAPDPSPAAVPAPTGSTLGPRPSFPAGAVLVTVADHLRVRSQPRVGDDSTMYEPVLPLATTVHALDGPVAGSGYWWYQVELTEGQTLYGGIRGGWIAAADHDGSRWIDWLLDVDPGPPLPSPLTGWPTVRRGDIRLKGDSVGLGDRGSLEIPVEIRGLLPGTVVHLVAKGDYSIGWKCGGGPEGEVGSAVTDGGHSEDAAEVEINVVVEKDGIGRAVVALPATQPTAPCPADYPGPRMDWSGRWEDVQVTDPLHGLVLNPDPYQWDTTI